MNISYITGSNGFLGSQLFRTIPDLFPIPHDAIQETDILPFENFYFLSSYGNMWGQEDIEETIEANVCDLIYVLKKISSFPFKSFIYVSTSSVKLDYQTPYSRSKNASEQILLAYMDKFKLPICIVRPFSITGVGEQKEHLIPKLIHSCMTGDLVNFVPGATHDFIDVKDVVAAIQQLSKKSVHGIYELGTGKLTTNQEVLEIVERFTRRKANINIVDSLRPYDNVDWFSTNYKARSWGWMPKIELKDSIKEMIKAYDK